MDEAFAIMEDAALVLVNVRPTTFVGVLALLHYALDGDVDDETWQQDLESDDGKTTRHWSYFLIENVTAALEALQ
jgi:hypothetical protein